MPADREEHPPTVIDGATVLEWAWSGDVPFGEVHGSESSRIHGLVIATYDGKTFNRFSCDKNWEVLQDGLYGSVEEAKLLLPDQYRHAEVVWRKIDGFPAGGN